MGARWQLKCALRRISARLERQRRLARVAWWAALGILLTGCLGGFMALGVLDLPRWAVVLPLVVCTAVGVASSARIRVSDREAARATDEALGLREELGSAVDLSIEGQAGALVDALIFSAASRAQMVRPEEVVPRLRPPVRHFRLLGLLGAVAAIAFLTAFLWPRPPAEEAAREAMKRESRRIVEIAKQVRTTAPPTLRDDAERLARQLEQLGRDFGRARLSKRDALERLGELTEELRRQQDTLANAEAARDLQAAADRMRDTSFASEQAQAIADDLEAGDLEAAREEVCRLAEQMRKGQLSQQELEELARDLRKMADAMKGSKQLAEAAEQLEKAASACKNGQCDQAGKAAAAAAEALSEAAEGAEKLSEAEAIEQLARELQDSQDAVSGCQGGGRQSGPESRDGDESSPGGKDLVSPEELERSGFDPDAPGGPGPGGGSTNQGQAAGPEGQKGSPDITAKGDPRETQYEELYGPRTTPHGSKNTRVRGQTRDGGSTATIDVKAPPTRSETFSPYFSVEQAAQAAREDALDDRSIPREYRDRVRSYFQSLN